MWDNSIFMGILGAGVMAGSVIIAFLIGSHVRGQGLKDASTNSEMKEV